MEYPTCGTVPSLAEFRPSHFRTPSCFLKCECIHRYGGYVTSCICYGNKTAYVRPTNDGTNPWETFSVLFVVRNQIDALNRIQTSRGRQRIFVVNFNGFSVGRWANFYLSSPPASCCLMRHRDTTRRRCSSIEHVSASCCLASHDDTTSR